MHNNILYFIILWWTYIGLNANIDICANKNTFMSKRAEGAKRGLSSLGPFNWPQGRRTSVPETKTDDARPL